MEQMETNIEQIEQKMSNCFCCKNCDYSTSRRLNYFRHLSTDKHKKRAMEPKWSQMEPKNEQNEQNEQFFKFVCVCGKSYAYNRGLSKHKKTCTYEQNMHLYKNDNELKDLTNLVLEVVKHNKELTALNHEAQKQNQELTNKIIEMSKTGIIINAQNNSNNKTFNLNVFLNETCKDAMNITEFVDSLKLQLADLEDVGKLGFVEGISKIIIKNLKALDVHKRPVHCADKKREIIYIKDEDKWEKENEQKLRLRKAIKQVAFKNENLLLKFKELYPGCNYSESKYADHYSKLVIEAFGGVGNNDIEKQNKIIRNITNEILIEKY